MSMLRGRTGRTGVSSLTITAPGPGSPQGPLGSPPRIADYCCPERILYSSSRQGTSTPSPSTWAR